MDKIETYIGFSVKKGSVVFGLDCLTRYRKKLYLVVVTQSVAEKTKANAKQYAEQRNVPFAVVSDYEILLKRNCKVLGSCDKSLADAIVANIQ